MKHYVGEVVYKKAWLHEIVALRTENQIKDFCNTNNLIYYIDDFGDCNIGVDEDDLSLLIELD